MEITNMGFYTEQKNGYFVFSLDTELGTGFFDMDEVRARQFSADGTKERESIKQILDKLDEYQLNATWAIVGHLFFENCEHCEVCPLKAWQGKYKSFNDAYGTSHPLWYGADVVDMIEARGARHEIGFHGYTHEVFDERSMGVSQAEIEIREWKRVAERRGIRATSVVFPRDWAGHHRLFYREGFTSFRGEEFQPLLIRNKYFGRYIKTLDHILSITTPPIYALDEIETVHGLVNLPESQHIFGFNRQVDLLLDARGLPLQRIKRIIRGIRKAAHEKKIIHIWAHPWEFRTEDDILRLDAIFKAVRQEIDQGNMQSVTMREMANILLNQKHQ